MCWLQWLTPDGFRSLFALIGTNGQGVGTSVFSAWQKNVLTLELSHEETATFNTLIDKIYDEMDEGCCNDLVIVK